MWSSCYVKVKTGYNTNFIIFRLTRLVLEPTIYRTQGEQANYYTTDAVNNWLETFEMKEDKDISFFTQDK
jgi:hypothetical protein